MVRSGKVGALALAMGALGLLGCPDVVTSVLDDDQAVPMGNGPITRVQGFDHPALKAALQGDWIVVRGDKRLFEFEITDEHVRVVDHRFAQPRIITGDLLLRSATSFGVQDGQGTAYFYGFAAVDGTTYMGQGGAIPFDGEEAMEVRLGAWETLVRTAEGCKLVTTFAGRATDKEVECGFRDRKGASGGKIFRYQAADPFRSDRLKAVELQVVGAYLMEDELVRSVASRRGGAPTPSAPKADEQAEGAPAGGDDDDPPAGD